MIFFKLMARYLVTGGCGSIGSAIVKRLLLNGDVVCSFDQGEDKLFYQSQLYKHDYLDNFKAFVGDVRDFPRLKQALKGIDYVYHCAALKHVALCEYNPFEALKTNVQGTNNVIDACLDNNVSGLVFASSDKAVNPSSTMGASKLLAEKLISASSNHSGKSQFRSSCVRFGNVWNTSGSVAKIFLSQSIKSESLRVTSSKMTRFFITIEKALDLCEYAMKMMKGGEVFVADMGALNILDLAIAFNQHYNNPSEIIYGNPSPGEKLYEELYTEQEAYRLGEMDGYRVILPQGQREKFILQSWDKENRFSLIGHEQLALRSDSPNSIKIDPFSLINML
mgnify:CR=1 FL=1